MMSQREPQPHSEDRSPGTGLRRRWRWIAGGAVAALAALSVIAALRSEGSERRGVESSRSALGTGADSRSSAASAPLASSRFSLLITAYHGEAVLGGRDVDLASLLGQGKPVVVNFWAGLCPPCRAEMPSFQRVYEEYNGAFILVGIDVGDLLDLGSDEDALALLGELGITYPTAYTQSDPFRDFAIRAMPTTFFFAADGSLTTQRSGLLTESAFRRLVDGLLASSR